VSLLHRQRRDDQLFAQLAMRRQLLSSRQLTTCDRLHDLPHDLSVYGKLGPGIDEDLHCNSDIYLYITIAVKKISRRPVLTSESACSSRKRRPRLRSDRLATCHVKPLI